MEIGHGQRGAVEKMVGENGELTLLQWIRDLAGSDRAVIAENTHG